MSSMTSRIESEAKACSRITNADLVCKDCLYKLDDSKVLGNTSRCRVYSNPGSKPDNVLTGKNCNYYKKG